MMFAEIGSWLAEIDLSAPARPWSESRLRFPDGRRWHIEIPSVEGPEVLRAVIEEAGQGDPAIQRSSAS